jgi:tRNA (guanine-N7-)-methyltransferase
LRRARRLPLEELAPYLLTVPEEPKPFSWSAVFGNDHPVEIEVGFGKGLFLLTSAQAQAHVNFLGVEVERKYQLFAATRIAKRKLRNVRLARADARIFLREFVAGQSCQAVHIYFPDPWWKTRHRKRRVFTPEFAAQCERILKPGGWLHLATDVEEYFGVMTRLLVERTGLRRFPTARTSEVGQDDFLTNFERKARLQGKMIYRASFER